MQRVCLALVNILYVDCVDSYPAAQGMLAETYNSIAGASMFFNNVGRELFESNADALPLPLALQTVHAFTVVVSVIFQEAARLGLVWCYAKYVIGAGMRGGSRSPSLS